MLTTIFFFFFFANILDNLAWEFLAKNGYINKGITRCKVSIFSQIVQVIHEKNSFANIYHQSQMRQLYVKAYGITS